MARLAVGGRPHRPVRETVLRHIEVDPVLGRIDEGKTLQRFPRNAVALLDGAGRGRVLLSGRRYCAVSSWRRRVGHRAVPIGEDRRGPRADGSGLPLETSEL